MEKPRDVWSEEELLGPSLGRWHIRGQEYENVIIRLLVFVQCVRYSVVTQCSYVVGRR